MAAHGDCILVVDASGRYLDANDAVLDLTGYSAGEVRCLAVGTLCRPEYARAARDLWRDVVARRLRLVPGSHADLRRRDGSFVEVALTAVRRSRDGRTFSIHWRPLRAGERRRPCARALHEVLGRWRALQRELDGLSAGNPLRRLLEREAESLRMTYQFESRRPPPPAVPPGRYA
jgi:PAS domain S-box-containing protein